MPRHTLAAPLLFLCTVSCTTAVFERTRSDAMTSAQDEEPVLRRAAETAQATLPDFLTKAVRLPAGTSAYALKVKLQQGGDTEYFWLDEFAWTDSSFNGKIKHEPRLLKGIKPGQTVTFSRSQVVDWKYFDEKSGRTVGDFTCALLRQRPPAQAEEIKRRHALDCE